MTEIVDSLARSSDASRPDSYEVDRRITRPLRVLVIASMEDHLRTWDLLSMIPGVELECLATYADGAAAILGGGFDAVVAHSDLDGASGAELVRVAAEAPQRVPVILLTTGSDGGSERSTSAGAAETLAMEQVTPLLLERTLRYTVERSRIEEQLRENRRSLATLLSNLPGMAYRCRADPQRTMEAVSDGVMDLVGIAADELAQRTGGYLDLIHPDDRRGVLETVEAAVGASHPFTSTYRIVTAAGTTRWVREQGRPISVPGGAAAVEGFVTDVTATRDAQEELHSSREYFRALIENAAEVFSVVNRDGTIRYTSPAVGRILGYPPGEREGRSVFDNLLPEDAAAAHDVFRRIVAAPGSVVEVTLRARHRDGTVRVLEVTARNLLDDPLLDGIVVNSRDVTARVEAERRLAESEQRYRSLIEHAQDIIAILEMTGDVRFTSPSIEQVLGYGRSEMVGHYLFELVHPDDVPGVMDVFRLCMESHGVPHRLEFRVLHKDGSWRTLETIGTSLMDDPSVAGIVLNARDATGRQEAEEALQRSQEQFLQSQKMEAVGRLAGGVAHDFNNLLTAIRGNADLLLMDLPGGDPAREDVEEIRRAADRATGLTRQLLAFSRRQVLQPRVLDLNALVGETERMLRRLIGEDVELVTALAPELGRVQADPGQLEQVLVNLVVNARDAIVGGGRLVIETANVDLDEEFARHYTYVAPGSFVMFAVSDTGHGMDRETRERVFEPFFTTKPTGKGTGLGLSTVYGIVKQSGGYIWVYSEPGRGTSIKVYLPRVGLELAPEPEEPAPALLRGTETILLVEDEETVRKLASRVLERSGYTVLTAADGEEALRLAGRHEGQIHLLLSDMVMPRMSGIQLARALAEHRPTTRVLFVSGYTEAAVQSHGVLEPGSAFIEKPFSPVALARKVRSVLD